MIPNTLFWGHPVYVKNLPGLKVENISFFHRRGIHLKLMVLDRIGALVNIFISNVSVLPIQKSEYNNTGDYCTFIFRVTVSCSALMSTASN